MTDALGDGAPFRDLALVVALLAACVLVGRLPAAIRWLDPVLGGVATWLRGRGLFVVADVRDEQRRLDLLRIALGALVTYRSLGNVATALVGGDPRTIAPTMADLILSVMLLVGLASPLASLLLLLSINLVIEPLTGTRGLGSVVLAINLTALTFAPAGRDLSLDARILARPDAVGRAWHALYDLIGPLTRDRAAVARFCLLVGYASINFSSGLMHLMTETWVSGLAVAWILSDPVITPDAYRAAHLLYESSPAAYVALTSAMTHGILVFQLGLLPLTLLGRWPRRVGLILELGFVLGASLLLALRMLGPYQLVALGILFWSLRWLAGRAPGWSTDPDPRRSAEGASAGLAACPSESRGGFTPLFRGLVLCFAVMLLAFVPRMLQPTYLPGVTLTPPAFHPANAALLADLARL